MTSGELSHSYDGLVHRVTFWSCVAKDIEYACCGVICLCPQDLDIEEADEIGDLLESDERLPVTCLACVVINGERGNNHERLRPLSGS
jgi:hypothetical protein